MLRERTRLPQTPQFNGFERNGQQDDRSVRQATGLILRQKEVYIRGTDINHLVVLLRTLEGPEIVVDLGPIENLIGLRLMSGTDIAVEGWAGRVNDRPVLFANRVDVFGRVVEIDRQQYQIPPSPIRRIDGVIVNRTEMEVREPGTRNVIVEIRDDMGRRIVADLGLVEIVGDLRLTRGNRITLWGQSARIDDQPVILASQVRVNGVTRRIDPPPVGALEQPEWQMRNGGILLRPQPRRW